MSDSKQLSQERYNQFAAGYVTSPTHAHGDELATLLSLANPQPDWHMLDVATGGGHTALKFAPHVAQVIATDLTPNMIAKARAFVLGKGVENVEFRVADAENLPFADASFDLVTCRIAAHHFPDVARFVAEAYRVLKAGGLLLVQDQVLPEDTPTAQYVDRFEWVRDPSHNRAFPESEWRTMFTQAGFNIHYTGQIIKRHNLVDWAKRQGNDELTIAELFHLLRTAPPIAAAWMDTQDLASPQASFCNHHLIILGRKA